MFNKALEVIEAKELFDLSPNQIEVVIHPQSLIHSVVGFCDAGMMAHIGPHDMRHAIAYAMYYPNRPALTLERLDLAKIGRLDFMEPDRAKYPALDLAYHVMQQGGLMGAAFNAAKETALDAFIAGQIGFLTMSQVVKQVLDHLSIDKATTSDPLDLDNILAMDALARTVAFDEINKI
jgi:1-deoxy-D-xylulose-5-phosphate reductoisomerase